MNSADARRLRRAYDHGRQVERARYRPLVEAAREAEEWFDNLRRRGGSVVIDGEVHHDFGEARPHEALMRALAALDDLERREGGSDG